MESIAVTETRSGTGFVQEFQDWWRVLPDKAAFGALLGCWILLFQFFGWTTTIAGKNASLFGWMWGKWSDPVYDSSHGKLIPFAVLAMLWFRRDRLIKSVTRAWWPGLVI